MDLDTLSGENARHDQHTSTSEPPHDALRLLEQQVGSEVRADHVEFPASTKGQTAEVLSNDANLLRDAILKCILPRHPNGCGIAVKGLNRLVTQLCRRNGKNP